jgi:hypothetical protein
MIPNHRQLLGLLETADPEFLAGAFTTDYPSATDTAGEAGTFTYFTEGFWDIRYKDGHRMLLAPWGSRQILADGSNEHGPPMTAPPRRPPWSLVLPRCSAFLGRADDERQISADIPAVEEDCALTVSLVSLEQPGFTGTMTVDTGIWAITLVNLGHVVERLVIERTVPNHEDVAVLEHIRASVRTFQDP